MLLVKSLTLIPMAMVEMISQSDFQVQFDLSKLPNGIYLMKTKNKTFKVEKE